MGRRNGIDAADFRQRLRVLHDDSLGQVLAHGLQEHRRRDQNGYRTLQVSTHVVTGLTIGVIDNHNNLCYVFREAIHVPFMAKFVVFTKRIDPLEARMRVFCMTDDKEDKTLEHQEHFTEVAKSRDVEVLEGKLQYVELAGNLIPVTKSGEQLQFGFRAFRENRLPCSVRVKDQHAEAIGRCLFMKEPKVRKSVRKSQHVADLARLGRKRRTAPTRDVHPQHHPSRRHRLRTSLTQRSRIHQATRLPEGKLRVLQARP